MLREVKLLNSNPVWVKLNFSPALRFRRAPFSMLRGPRRCPSTKIRNTCPQTTAVNPWIMIWKARILIALVFGPLGLAEQGDTPFEGLGCWLPFSPILSFPFADARQEEDDRHPCNKRFEHSCSSPSNSYRVPILPPAIHPSSLVGGSIRPYDLSSTWTLKP